MHQVIPSRPCLLRSINRQDVTGSPELAGTIKRKIRGAAIFIGDVTAVSRSPVIEEWLLKHTQLFGGPHCADGALLKVQGYDGPTVLHMVQRLQPKPGTLKQLPIVDNVPDRADLLEDLRINSSTLRRRFEYEVKQKAKTLIALR